MMNLDEELREAASCYHHGLYQDAYQRYLSLAENGHADSQVFVGWMLSSGTGVDQDTERASSWFYRAASLGSVKGAFYFGRYLTSQGRHEDALSWYRKASDQGYIPATFRVGYSFVRGKGTAVDLGRGYRYLNTAARFGHIFALREIAIQDIKGNRGIPRRVTGFFVLLYAVLLGVVISYTDRYSERLLA